MPSVTFCFRLRIEVGDHVHLNSELHELALAGPEETGEPNRVLLMSVTPNVTLANARRLVLRGSGYASWQEAASAGQQWQSALTLAFARINLGADFGVRAGQSGFNDAGLERVAGAIGRRVLNDTPGLTVFECDPTPAFVHLPLDFVVGKTADRLLEAVQMARQHQIEVSAEQHTAFDLYSASFFLPSPDARFLTLMTAVEALIQPGDRPEEVRRHVERLIAETKAAGLPGDQTDSIIGSLSWLQQESIGQAGRRLTRALEGQTYLGESASTFFTRCYRLRSQLVHGAQPRPDRTEVDRRGAELERFTGHLLCGPLLRLMPGS